jgi:hypothetical protein
MLQFKEILMQILLRKDQIGIPILKTRLLKIAYLVEVEYFRSFRERISETEWVYYKYGPYVYGYDDVLKENEFFIRMDGIDDDYAVIELKDPYQSCSIKSPEKLIIDRIVKKYGSIGLNQLLDLVYFNTEPMTYVTNVRDVLDFSIILPKQEYSDTSKVIPRDKLSKVRLYVAGRRNHVRQI